MHLNKRIEIVQRGLAEGWSTDRLLLETGMARVDLKELIHRIRSGYASAHLWGWHLGDPWHRQWRSFMVVGDVHTPFTDYAFAGRVAAVARKELKAPRILIIGGDYFNMDAFSSYGQLVQRPGWNIEREAARELLHEWMDAFDQIYMILGNHDRRLQRFTAGAFEEDDILALLTTSDKVQMSRFGYMTVDTPNGVYRITHQKNYSKIPLRVADTLANKYRQHIISHHEHHLGVAKSSYGQNLIINNGSLVDVEQLAYVKLDDSTSCAMEVGFVLIKDGYPYIYGDDVMTDWRKYGKHING